MTESRKALIGVALISVVVASLRFDELAGDPGIYRNRMALLFDGQVPYLDFFFEHLPLAIIPMAVPWLLGGAFGEILYTVLFAVLMALCLYATLSLVERIGDAVMVEQSGVRWVAVAGWLFPIVLFRYDPIPVLLVMVSVVGFMGTRGRNAAWSASVGVLVKGWPVVLAMTEWWRGRRWRAAGLGALALAMTVLVALPGFSRVRAFSGIHSETLSGGVFTLVRLRTGSPFQLIPDAGATYVAVPVWAIVANLTLGVLLLVLALYKARGEFSWDRGIRLLGAATVAILIGSPLLSPQFLLWPTPFLALHSNSLVRRLAIGVSLLTLLYMLGWNPGFEGDLWWVGVMNLRNLVLVVLGVVAAVTVTGGRTPVATRAP